MEMVTLIPLPEGSGEYDHGLCPRLPHERLGDGHPHLFAMTLSCCFPKQGMDMVTLIPLPEEER